MHCIASTNEDRKLYNLIMTGKNMNEICSNTSMMQSTWVIAKKTCLEIVLYPTNV